MSKSDLTLDEPIATGWLRTTLAGDTEKAKGYITTARKVLGAMKTKYGINERVANGEPGGFYRDSRVLPDGTRIEAWTNDGHDTLRITVPVPESTLPPTWVGEGESTSFEGAPTSYSFTPEWPSKEEEESRPPLYSFHPYLWIGARIVSGDQEENGTFKNRLHLCVFESQRPGVPDQVLSNRNHLMLGRTDGADPAVYPLGPVALVTPKDAPFGYGYLPSGLVQLSTTQPDSMPASMLCPQDNPTDPATVLWDEIVLADPNNDLGLLDADGQPLTGEATGDYLVKVMVIGPDCGPVGPCVVELRIVVGKSMGDEGDLVMDDQVQFTINEFTGYNMGILPFGWFEPPVKHGTDSCQTCSIPADDYGANPHGPHWWQGGATVTVPPPQAGVPREVLFSAAPITFSMPGEVLLPPAGFEPGAFPAYAERCVACETLVTFYATYSAPASYGFETIQPTCPMLNPPVPFFSYPGVRSIRIVLTYANLYGDPLYATSPLHTDYGLSLSTTAVAADGWSIILTIGDGSGTDRIAYYASEYIATTSPEGAFCGAGIWFPGPLIVDTTTFHFWENVVGRQSLIAGFGAPFKYSRVIDQHGNIVPGSKKAQWVSQAEFDAIVFARNPDGTFKYEQIHDPIETGGAGGGTVVYTCVRVAQDD